MDRRAKVGPGARPITIYITGTRYSVSYWGEDRVDIGCTSKSIDEWLNNYTDIAKEHNFTVGEIEETRVCVEFIAKLYAKSRGNEERNSKEERRNEPGSGKGKTSQTV